MENRKLASVFIISLLGLPATTKADMPLAEDFYPLGKLCKTEQGLGMTHPDCIFDAKKQNWACHPATNICPDDSNRRPRYGPPGVDQRCGMVNGERHCDVSITSEQCPSNLSYSQGDQSGLLGACGCALWIVQGGECGEGGCGAPAKVSRLSDSGTTDLDLTNLHLKFPITGFYCDEASKTPYFLAGSEGDEGPAGPEGDGILVYHPGATELERAYSRDNGLLDNNPRNMIADGNEIWIVTLTGVQRLDQRARKWSYWRVKQGRITSPTDVIPKPGDDGLVLAHVDKGRTASIIGYLEDYPEQHVCIKLPSPAYAWTQRSNLHIGGPGGKDAPGMSKYSLSGDVYAQPDENSAVEKPWYYYGPSCPQWKPVIPLETSPDGQWIKISDEFGVIGTSAFEPDLEPITK